VADPIDDDPFDPGPLPRYGRCELDAHCPHYAAGTAPCCNDGCGACPPGTTALACGHCARVNLWTWAQATVGADLRCPKCGLATRVIDVAEPHCVRGRVYPDASDLEKRDAEIARLTSELAQATYLADLARDFVTYDRAYCAAHDVIDARDAAQRDAVDLARKEHHRDAAWLLLAQAMDRTAARARAGGGRG
jgi:hypothetical protein